MWFGGGGGDTTENGEKMEAVQVMAYRSNEGAAHGEGGCRTFFL
jgi:hypothetical protein